MPPFTSKSAKAELKLQMSDIKDDIATMVAIRQLTGKRTLSIKTSREQLRTMIYVYNGDLENAQKALTKYREICTGIIDGMMESSTNTGMIDICSGAPSVVQGNSEKSAPAVRAPDGGLPQPEEIRGLPGALEH